MRAHQFRPGERYGHWEFLEEVSSEKSHRKCRARCSCGTVKVVNLASVRCGQSRSCKKCSSSMGSRKHGMWKSAEYHTWAGAKQRCHNPNSPSYHNYGGRGIVVCERWRDSFANFLADMGKRPSRQHSLDRIDNNGPYSPTNCRWATLSEQRLNKCMTRWERVLRALVGTEADRVRELINSQATDEAIVEYIARHIARTYYPIRQQSAA